MINHEPVYFAKQNSKFLISSLRRVQFYQNFEWEEEELYSFTKFKCKHHVND